MTLTKTAAFAALALTCASAAPLAAQVAAQPRFAPLELAAGSADVLRPSPALRAFAAAEAAALAASDSLFSFDRKIEFPAPDAATLAFLRARIPGLPAESVRAVPASVIDEALSNAAARAATFMDLLTDPALRGAGVYYASPEALQRAHDKYVIGILPPAGNAKDGRPFHMVAAVGGQGRLNFLYDRTDAFEFDEAGHTFKIVGGRVSGVITAPGVIDQVSGFAVRGCWGPFCKWADFMKWQKEGADKVHVWVRVGSSVHDQVSDLTPIHPK